MARAPVGPAQPAVLLCCALLACFALACAGAGAGNPPSAEGSGREASRGLLAKTTPNAAPAADAAAAPGGDDAATHPGRLLIYSAITGHVPLEERNPNDPSDRYRTPAEREAARARGIEAEIEAELARQEPIDAGETATAPPPSPAPFDPAANPLAAPPAPELRELPTSLFESREMSVPPGQWQNQRELRVVRRQLDVDEDGAPEEVRFYDATSGVLLRAELDRDFDGTLDTWITYENGAPAIQVSDSDGGAQSDTWERYRDGLLEAKTLDRDRDGVKDTFFRYEGGELSRMLRDANNDGTIDRVEYYADRRRVRTEEDRTLNGFMDTWTSYQVVDGAEVVARIERDSRDRGKPDVFETYETSDGQTLLAHKEEDVDGDGSIDVVSTYEGGRLVQRAISDEALSPL